MAQRKTILIVDDDTELREALAEQLDVHESFLVAQAADGNDGVRQAKELKADLILLDVDLPDIDGREVCRQIRAAGVSSPVIMLTAAGGDNDTIRGLDAGANDYVTKPFRFAVLLARIRAQLRSHEQSEDAVFRIGPYEFRPASKLLIDERQHKVRLTEKETSILKYLYRAGEKSVSREELLAEVWGYNAGVTTHTLETHVYRLRQKIEPDANGAKLLLTETGGYRLAP
jgi:DNA-binding response OmpR family regulator